MTTYYRDYVWKGGLPYGTAAAGDLLPADGVAYKIASDPYHKRVSIEKYENGDFAYIIYDSALFNFRHLKPNQQIAWEKRFVEETSDTAICHLFDQDDRFVVIEKYRFQEGLCRECITHSPHAIPLSRQKMFYVELGDPFNGVELYDREGKIVMSKRYEFDSSTREFTVLLQEVWEH